MILIAGGTGILGRDVVRRLVTRGLDVRVLARHAPADDAIPAAAQVVVADVRDRPALDRALVGVDTVVSAITGFGGREALGSAKVDRDGNIQLIAAAREAGVRHVVLLSVLGASPSHPIHLFRDKWAAEEALRGSGLEWTIIRPTAYLESWLKLVGDPLVKTGTARIFGRGRNPINFVSARDVAQVVERAVVDPSLRNTAIDVAGPDNLTMDDLASTVASVIGREGRRQHLPRPVMRIAAGVTSFVNPVISAQIAAALVMDTRDMRVDGPAGRRAFPTIPMTTAGDVAAELYGAARE